MQLLADPQAAGDSGGVPLLPRARDPEEALQLLSETRWDDTDPASAEQRVAAYRVLCCQAGEEPGVETAVLPLQGQEAKSGKDKWDSYGSLVRDAGY